MIQTYFTLFITLLLIASSSFGLAEVKKTQPEPTLMMSAETRLLISLLEQAHFDGTSISDLELDRLLPNFMSDLDYNHLFFTEDDHDKIIARYGDEIGEDLRSGHLKPAFEIYDIYRERALARTD